MDNNGLLMLLVLTLSALVVERLQFYAFHVNVKVIVISENSILLHEII